MPENLSNLAIGRALRGLLYPAVYIWYFNRRSTKDYYFSFIKEMPMPYARVVPRSAEMVKFIKVDEKFILENGPMEIIEPVWYTGNIDEGEAQYKKSLEAFSREQRYIFAILWYSAEVNNGGHDQFFTNSTGLVRKDALEGFQVLGLDEAAKNLAASAEKLGGQPSLDYDTRQQQLEDFEPDFDEQDNLFYEIEGQIDERMIQFIRENASAFFFEGKVRVD